MTALDYIEIIFAAAFIAVCIYNATIKFNTEEK